MNLTNEEKAVARAYAQSDFYFFVRYMFQASKGYKWSKNWHHDLICESLMKVYRGEVKNLIINIPPRYSKTEIAVVNFIAWALGKNPKCNFIHTSYSVDLARSNLEKSKLLIKSEEYQQIFDVRIQDGNDGKKEWMTESGGIVYASGVKGGLTGFGAGALIGEDAEDRPEFSGAIIIDDPLKATEGRSDTVRGGINDWFIETLQSRRNSRDTPIILIMQRLHEEDLSGFLLDGGSSEEWHHVKIPALQKDGSALWGLKHTAEELNALDRANPYMFAGQYQQEPAPGEGGEFKVANIEIVNSLPSDLKNFTRGWDFAGTDGGGDYSATIKLARDKSGNTWILHGDAFQYASDQVRKNIKLNADLDGLSTFTSMPQDPGQAGKAQANDLSKFLSGHRFEFTLESGSKIVRAEPLAAQVNLGNVKMLKGDWNKEFIHQLRMFPNGKNDDYVDAASRAFNSMNNKGNNLWDVW